MMKRTFLLKWCLQIIRLKKDMLFWFVLYTYSLCIIYKTSKPSVLSVSYICDRIVWRVNEFIILLYVQRRSVGKKVFDSLETSGFVCPTKKSESQGHSEFVEWHWLDCLWHGWYHSPGLRGQRSMGVEQDVEFILGNSRSFFLSSLVEA